MTTVYEKFENSFSCLSCNSYSYPFLFIAFNQWKNYYHLYTSVVEASIIDFSLLRPAIHRKRKLKDCSCPLTLVGKNLARLTASVESSTRCAWAIVVSGRVVFVSTMNCRRWEEMMRWPDRAETGTNGSERRRWVAHLSIASLYVLRYAGLSDASPPWTHCFGYSKLPVKGGWGGGRKEKLIGQAEYTAVGGWRLSYSGSCLSFLIKGELIT